jgi:hypothetical protein
MQRGMRRPDRQRLAEQVLRAAVDHLSAGRCWPGELEALAAVASVLDELGPDEVQMQGLRGRFLRLTRQTLRHFDADARPSSVSEAVRALRPLVPLYVAPRSVVSLMTLLGLGLMLSPALRAWSLGVFLLIALWWWRQKPYGVSAQTVVFGKRWPLSQVTGISDDGRYDSVVLAHGARVVVGPDLIQALREVGVKRLA